MVRSGEAFSIVARIFGGKVRVGTYLISEPENTVSLALRLAEGVTGLSSVKVTIPEGLSNREVAERLRDALPGFDVPGFLSAAEGSEGYLFPDTYFFLPGVLGPEAFEVMRSTFNTRTAPLMDEISASGRTLDEIVTMASLIEEEARQSDTRKIVSGILWKRIKIGMALQVDAVFGYILGKSGYAPTGSDLKIDSPYNTYTNRGLPPTPIANPSLDSIEAALRPTETQYLYYLTGKDGNMYYAKTFDEHIQNRKYLR